MAAVTPDPFHSVPVLPPPSYALPAAVTTVLPPVDTSTAAVDTTVPSASAPIAEATTPRRAERRARRRARRHIPIGSTVLFLTVLAGVVAQVGEGLDWWRVDAGDAVLVGLLAVTAGFIVSKLVNHSWVLVPVVVLCAAATVAYAVAEPDLEGSIGLRTVQPFAVAELDAREHLAIGSLTLDLRTLDLAGGTVVLDGDVGVGELKVLLPTGTGLELRGSVNSGRMSLFGETVGLGTGIDQRVIIAPETAGAGTLVLDLHVGGGELEIHRMP